jgi:hypothetical protein
MDDLGGQPPWIHVIDGLTARVAVFTSELADSAWPYHRMYVRVHSVNVPPRCQPPPLIAIES